MTLTASELQDLTFRRDGAQLVRAAVVEHLDELREAFADLPSDRAGFRLRSLPTVQHLFAAVGPVGCIAASVLGPDAKPVRALHFDKSVDTNWALDWHQDRTICVEERREAPGFGPWTVKAGLAHVAPPYELLSRMVTLRIHLDDVAPDNAPLLIAPGSHRIGRIAEPDLARAVVTCGIFACLATAGDVWLYSTPILHASERAINPRHRRVLQLDYAAFELPYGLRWRSLV